MSRLLTTEKSGFHHNFMRINKYSEDIPSLRRPSDKTMAKWWCNQCDTLVQYPKTLSNGDINRLMANSKLPCVSDDEIYKPIVY